MEIAKRIDRPVETLALALAWVLPMGAFARVPLFDFSLSGILLFLMAVASLHCGYQHRLRRPPFEYWWPAALLILIAALSMLHNDGAFSRYILQGIVAFLTAIILASNGTVACRAIATFGAACGLSALMHWGAEFSWLPPTVVAPSANLLLAGPATLESGLMFLFGGLLANVVVLVHPGFSRRQGYIALLASLALLGGLFHALPALFSWGAIALHQLNSESLAALLLLLWLSARVMARSVLHMMGQRNGRLTSIPIAIGFLTVIHILASTPPPVGLIFLLGLFAALDSPWCEHRPRSISWPLWAVPVVCVLLQLSGLLPLEDTDPRNQSARGERLLEAAQWNELDALLSCMLERQPTHADYMLLHARSFLGQGWSAAAVAAYCSVPYAETASTPFQARNRRAFLDDLRDVTSAQRQGHVRFLFERALAHDNAYEQVRNLLSIRQGRVDDTVSVDSDANTLRQGLSLLVGAPESTLELAGWERGSLAAVLTHADVVVARLPDSASPTLRPMLLTARSGPDGLYIAVTSLQSGSTERFHSPSSASTSLAADPLLLAWQSWRQGANGSWEIDLKAAEYTRATLRVGAKNTVTFRVHSMASNIESTATILFGP